MNKKHNALILIIGLLFNIALCSCESRTAKDAKEKQAVNIDDAVISDSQTVYKDDDETSIVTMYLTVSEGNEDDNTNHTWREVNDHSVFYYEEQGIKSYAVEGILQVGDENGPVSGMFGYGEFAPNCTVRIRGKTSTRSPQKSYRIDIRKGKGYWRGQQVINLNKHVYDSVRFRNKLSYDLLKTVPHAFSARTQFVHLYVKDLTRSGADSNFHDYGLYTQVEQINKSYLRNHGLDENGQLYKAGMFEFLRYENEIRETGDPEYDEDAFNSILEIKGNTDHSKLIAMLDDINNYAMPIESVFPRHFEEQNYFTWLAFQIITGNTDTNSQNFFLYSPQNSNKWYFISWDNDGAWRYEENIVYKGAGRGYNYTQGVSNYWGCILHQRVLKSAEYREKLTRKIEELREIITKERVEKMVKQYAAITRNFLSRQPDSMYSPRKMDEFENILAMIPREIDYQFEVYKVSLEHPMPFYLNLPEHSQDKISFSWDSAYDFGNSDITYTFEVSKSYSFNSIISKQTGLTIPQAFVKSLEPGQYFYRVTAANTNGKTQTAMEIYIDSNDNKHYGVMEFYVKPDGTILTSQ